MKPRDNVVARAREDGDNAGTHKGEKGKLVLHCAHGASVGMDASGIGVAQ